MSAGDGAQPSKAAYRRTFAHGCFSGAPSFYQVTPKEAPYATAYASVAIITVVALFGCICFTAVASVLLKASTGDARHAHKHKRHPRCSRIRRRKEKYIVDKLVEVNDPS
jgi:hypothetical protein